jgi:hypothetical protein
MLPPHPGRQRAIASAAVAEGGSRSSVSPRSRPPLLQLRQPVVLVANLSLGMLLLMPFSSQELGGNVDFSWPETGWMMVVRVKELCESESFLVVG